MLLPVQPNFKNLNIGSVSLDHVESGAIKVFVRLSERWCFLLKIDYCEVHKLCEQPRSDHSSRYQASF